MSGKAQVIVRVRPRTSTDGPIGPSEIKLGSTSVSVPAKTGDRYAFNFNRCYNEKDTNDDIFESILPLLDSVLRGDSATVLAYGVTGSGKTHGTASDPGIIPRIIDHLFMLKENSAPSELEISLSYVEILKDQVYDLLGSRANIQKLDIREGADGSNIIVDLTKTVLDSEDEFVDIYGEATGARKTAATKLNSNSSRSHAILTVHVVSTRPDSGRIVSGKINLVDLAGSENNNLTGNDKERMEESKAINTSLTALGNVVEALRKGGNAHVSYRSCKLTRLLKDTLGGQSQAILLCCLAPGEKFAKDTLNTLNFANRTKQIVKEPPASRPRPPLKVLPSRRISTARPAFSISTSSNITRPLLARPVATFASSQKENQSLGPKQTSTVKREPLGQRNVNGSHGLSESQIDAKIQKTVSDMFDTKLAEAFRDRQLKIQPDFSTVASAEPSSAPIHIASGLSYDERKKIARSFVETARTKQRDNKLQDALEDYCKALEFMPHKVELGIRINDLRTAIAGQGPVPKLSSASMHERDQFQVSSEQGGGKRIRRVAFEDDQVESTSKKTKV